MGGGAELFDNLAGYEDLYTLPSTALILDFHYSILDINSQLKKKRSFEDRNSS